MASADDIRERARDWIAAGIVDVEQADRIVAFERDRDSAAGAAQAGTDTRARMQALFGVLGGLLVGLGVLLTVATNWADIVDPLKVTIIVVSMLVAYAVALIADGRGAPRWAGSVAWVVGVGIFAGGLGIIGDVFNVEAHKPLAALLVALAATAIGLLAERMMVGWIAGAAWLGWLAWELGNSLDGVPEERFAGALVSCIVFIGAAGIAASFAIEGSSRTAGARGASGWRVLLQRMHVLELPLRSVALLMLLVVLVQSSFAWHWDWDLDAAPPRPEQWIALVIAAVACAMLVQFGQLVHRRWLAIALIGAGLGALAVVWIHEQHLAAVAAAVALGLGGIGLVLLGMVESRGDLFVWGIAWLAVLVVTRYLDFVFAVDLGGPGFIGAGLLLIAIAWLVGRSRTLWSRREEVVG